MIREVEYEDASIRRWALWTDDRTKRVGTDIEDITPASVNAAALTARGAAALADLRLLANTTGNLSSAQLSDGMRLIARVMIVIARLALQRLEAMD